MSNLSKQIDVKIQEEFALVVTNFLMQMSNVQTSNRVCHFALKVAAPQLAKQDQQNLSALEANVPIIKKVLKDFDQKLGGKAFGTLASGMTENSLKNAARHLDAAAIVFCHSLLDAALFTFCSLCHQVSPNDWLGFVKERKIKVTELIEKSKDDLLLEKSKNYLEELERESLLVKANTLCTLCKPPPNPGYIKNYSFSLSDLEKFDKTRIGIVHAMHFKKSIQGVDAMLDFAQKTGLYFSTMIARKYGLQMIAGNDFWPKLRNELAQ